MKRSLFGLGHNSFGYSRRWPEIFEEENYHHSQNLVDYRPARSEIRDFDPYNNQKEESAGSFKEQQKKNADMNIEGTTGFDGEIFINLKDYIDPTTGKPVDLFIDTHGGGDSVKSGDGNDVIYLGEYNDTYCTVESGGGNDFVMGSSFADGAWLGGGNDIFFGQAGHDMALGMDGHDVMFGGKGPDYLTGGGGKDYLDGEDGNDILLGDEDADTFIIDLQDTGRDWIVDFKDIGDRILVMNGSNESAAGDDWFLQKNQVADFGEIEFNFHAELAKTSPGEVLFDTSQLNCFNIINASTGEIAASVTATHIKTEPLNDFYQFISTTKSSLQLVEGVDATMVI